VSRNLWEGILSGRNGGTEGVWHIITPEYPPRIGGVSHYTCQVVKGLREAGDEVHVWAGGRPDDSSPSAHDQSDCVHWLPEGMGPRGLKRLNSEIESFRGPLRLLVQWVPHGYGWNSMNIPFCLWLWRRARRGDRVEIMLHEAFLEFSGNLRQRSAALVHRVMTMILLQAASQVWMSTESWKPMWSPYCLGRRVTFTALPVPTNIPVVACAAATSRARLLYSPDGQTVIGHFSTYGKLITRMMDPLIPVLLRNKKDRVLLLIGKAGERYRTELLRANPDLTGRILASPAANAAEISILLQSCDLLLQPFPEGITTRRTSAMAGLAHGIPVVSNAGPMTESFWADSGAIGIAPGGEPADLLACAEAILEDPVARGRLTQRAREFYDEEFDVRHMIRALREGVRQSGARERTACCA
jgi:glycosyltransferase involved in cell wall biosynthesis